MVNCITNIYAFAHGLVLFSAFPVDCMTKDSMTHISLFLQWAAENYN